MFAPWIRHITMPFAIQLMLRVGVERLECARTIRHKRVGEIALGPGCSKVIWNPKDSVSEWLCGGYSERDLFIFEEEFRLFLSNEGILNDVHVVLYYLFLWDKQEEQWRIREKELMERKNKRRNLDREAALILSYVCMKEEGERVTKERDWALWRKNLRRGGMRSHVTQKPKKLMRDKEFIATA